MGTSDRNWKTFLIYTAQEWEGRSNASLCGMLGLVWLAIGQSE